MQTAAANLWYAELGSLTQRLGELRLGKDQGGVWVRALGSHQHVDSGYSRAFKQQISGVQVGADRALALDGATLYLGGMVGTGESEQSFGERSSGDLDSQSVGLYATYLRDDGWYVDNVLKYDRMHGKVKVPTNLGAPVKGRYDADAIGASVEVGKQIALRDGWFVEPQAQLAATRLEGPSYTSGDGLRVKASDTDSLLGRVGVRAGKTLQLDSGMKMQNYLKTSYIDELAGDTSVTVNGHKLHNQLPGSRVEVGFGSVLQVSERQKINLEANYANGDDIEQPWAVTLGYRFLW
ncbi:Pertactin autotransporter precursor [compost metagenome]